MILDIKTICTPKYIKISFKNLYSQDYNGKVYLRKAVINSDDDRTEYIMNNIIKTNSFPIFISSTLFTVSNYDKISNLDVTTQDEIEYYVYQKPYTVNNLLKDTLANFKTYIGSNDNDVFNLSSTIESMSTQEVVSLLNSLIFDETNTVFITYFIDHKPQFSDIDSLFPSGLYNITPINIEAWVNANKRIKYRVNMLIFSKVYDQYVNCPEYNFLDVTDNILTGANLLIDTDIDENKLYIYQFVSFPNDQENDIFYSNVFVVKSIDYIMIKKPQEMMTSKINNFSTAYILAGNVKLNPMYLNYNNYQIHLHRQNIINTVKLIEANIKDLYNEYI